MQKIVLIVDEDKDVRNSLRKVLLDNNFIVLEAADGAIALEKVAQTPPDLIILDLSLPKVSGESVCMLVKRDYPNTVVIVLTEKSNSEDVVHSLRIGADDYMSKPFVVEELLARIESRFKTNGDKLDAITKPTATSPTPPSVSSIEEPSTINAGRLILRESISIVALRLICSQFIFGIVFFLINTLASVLSQYLTQTDLLMLSFLMFVFLLFIDVLFVLSIVLRWLSEYTEVSKEGIVKHVGILYRREKKYACNFVETITLQQSLMGLFLNYGTLKLFDRALPEKIHISNISNPKKYNAIFEKMYSQKTDEPKIFEG